MYKKFPKAELIKKENWNKLATMSKKEVEELHNEWSKIEKDNTIKRQAVINKENEVLKEINEVFDKHNIPYKKYSKSNFLKCIGYTPWYKKNIYDNIRKYHFCHYEMPYASLGTVTIDDITYNINFSPCDLLKAYNTLSHQYLQGQNKLNSKNKLLIESIKYATVNNINIDELDEQSIINTVNLHAKEKFIESEYPNGTSVYLKHVCQECDEWIVGERRCSCGNRRVGLEVEGNLLEGYYAYPEGY